MSGDALKAEMRRAPRSGDGVQIAVTTTTVVTALPSHFPGQRVQVKCVAGAARILFGGSTVDVDATATSGATFGYPLATNETQEWVLRQGETHIAVDAGTSATVEVWFCGGKGL